MSSRTHSSPSPDTIFQDDTGNPVPLWVWPGLDNQGDLMKQIEVRSALIHFQITT